DRADRHLADLRAAADDDDALAVDALEGLDLLDLAHRVERAELGQQRLFRVLQLHLEVDAARLLAALQDVDGGDVALVARDHAGELVQHARTAAGANLEAESAVAHGAPLRPRRRRPRAP